MGSFSFFTNGCVELNATRYIHEHQHQIAGLQRFVNLLQHAAVELGAQAYARRECRRRRFARPLAHGRALLRAAGTSTTPTIRLRVVCGLAVTIATFSPVRALSRVLLPTLGRPRMATNPDFTRYAAPD